MKQSGSETADNLVGIPQSHPGQALRPSLSALLTFILSEPLLKGDTRLILV